MINFLKTVYVHFFARRAFYRFNKFIYTLSLNGMGILNYKSDKLSGEECFIKQHMFEVSSGVVLDVGANVGSYSKKIRDINENIPIFSFEPHPETFKKLEGNVMDLNINVVNAAIGSNEGTLALYDYESNDGSEHASVYQGVIEEIHKGQVIAHQVQMKTLKRVVSDYHIERVALLKIDTEGHELEVLKGFESYIKENKVDLIHFEFNNLNVISRVFFKDFWDILPNYNFYRMVQDGLVPMNVYDPVYCEIFAYQNIVAKLKEVND